MKTIAQILRTTIVAGFYFLAPIIVLDRHHRQGVRLHEEGLIPRLR